MWCYTCDWTGLILFHRYMDVREKVHEALCGEFFFFGCLAIVEESIDNFHSFWIKTYTVMCLNIVHLK